ncbi:MAG: hypothetical protein ACR2O3_09730 [Rhizobiaceae bacterium]
MTTKSEEAERAVEKVFSDTSVSIDETMQLLSELRDSIDEKITALSEDLRNL